MSCVFCAIADGHLPAHTIHEDEHFLVLLDIFPLRPAHLLIVARGHAPFLADLPNPARDALLALAARMSRVLYASDPGVQGINLLLNDGPVANQHVPHLHLHLLPRRRGDLMALCWRILTRFLPQARRRLDARLAREAEMLRSALQRES
ncbi:HIT family protein [Aquipseudomonas ullengensis]|uniref:HIT family protein n=1 Tax=Aquipseudomonas ullengensis TaxID=2759166 RepID=A0A7W4LKZ9_9GAMM|nr:HIT family protein [Pseudomonas ullengensis]MBB2495115.1 HIT family protein [Pseudomonas ullengensis]